MAGRERRKYSTRGVIPDGVLLFRNTERIILMVLTDLDSLRALFGKGGITLSEEQYARLVKYASLLVDWNSRMNLTAITDPAGIAEKHFFDSVYPFAMADILPEGVRLIDVGTGAGFPSCPLKIFRGDIELTLLDSLNKRINFLTELSDEIGLGARCIHGRAEELGRKPEHRGKYGAATARAVANLSALCEYCLPFVKTGGAFIALKGPDGAAELRAAENAVKVLGGEVERCEEYALPGGDGRSLIVIRKIRETPEKYPRNKGQMTKKPL